MYLPKDNEPKKRLPRADELSEKQQEDLNMNFRLICLVEGGKSPAKALKHLKEQLAAEGIEFKKKKRWAQTLVADYYKKGTEALFDKRTLNKRPTVLTPEVKNRILSIWFARRAAKYTAIHSEIKKFCKKNNFDAPSYATVHAFLSKQEEATKLMREGKTVELEKQAKPTNRINNTTYSNERWQIDHCRLDIWVRECIDGEWLPKEVWLTAVIDAHSRSIPGFVLSTKQPDAWTNAILLRQAIMPKSNKNWKNFGKPNVLQPDRGKDFMSHAFLGSLALTKIEVDPDPPYYPRRKGKVERWFRTLNDGCLCLLPGFMKNTSVREKVAEQYVPVLLTRKQLLKEIETWIVESYHERVHSETNRKPAEFWENTVRISMPESDDILDSLLLKSDVVRTVQNTGVKFTVSSKQSAGVRGGDYWSPELAYYWKREVRVRYNPEDLESILLYCAATGEYLCEVWLMGYEDSKFSHEDVMRTGKEYMKGLIERQKQYAEEVYEEDRRRVREDIQKEAAKTAEKIAEASPEEPVISPEEAEIDDLLEEFLRAEEQ